MAVNIVNTVSNTLLSGTSGKDTIENSGYDEESDEWGEVGSKVTIDARAGNDIISNSGNDVSISGGKGNDNISNGEEDEEGADGGSNVTIDAGAGNDDIFNNGNGVSISGSKGNDNIRNGGNEEDYDVEGGPKVTIDAGAGNDNISNRYCDYVSISGGEGNDTIENGYDLGDDIGSDEEWGIYRNGGEYITISGGAGKDYIYSDGGYVSLSGGDGNDTVRSYLGYDMTINGGKGNDYIDLYDVFTYYGDTEDGYEEFSESYEAKNVLIQYSSGDGNDVIHGFNSTDTLKITEESYTTVQSGTDLIVKVGDGSITLENVSSANIEINLPAGLSYNSDKTKITASKKFVGKSFNMVQYPQTEIFDAQKITRKLEITGNSLNNTIEGGKKKDTIYGGEGDDKIFGNAGNDKLYGDAGNDYLYGGTGNDALTGGEGDDSLHGGAGKDTLTGGDGNDVFVHMTGNDFINDYTEGVDYIRLSDCSVTGSSVKGNDVILNTTTGSITVKNGKGKEICLITAQVFGSSSSSLFAEDNFAMTDNLSEIVAEKSVGEIEFSKPEKISQENLITFTAK